MAGRVEAEESAAHHLIHTAVGVERALRRKGLRVENDVLNVRVTRHEPGGAPLVVMDTMGAREVPVPIEYVGRERYARELLAARENTGAGLGGESHDPHSIQQPSYANQAPPGASASGRVGAPVPALDLPMLRRSPRRVFCEDVVAVLYNGVTGEPALCVVTLRRLVSLGARRESVGGCVMLELGIAPSAAVREPLAVLHHEINVMLGTWHRRLAGCNVILLRDPMNFRHLGTVRERLAVARHAFLESCDHGGIAQDGSDLAAVLADGDNLPAFVPPELGKGE